MRFRTDVLYRKNKFSSVFKSSNPGSAVHANTACFKGLNQYYELRNVKSLVVVASTKDVRDSVKIDRSTPCMALYIAKMKKRSTIPRGRYLWWWVEIVEKF